MPQSYHKLQTESAKAAERELLIDNLKYFVVETGILYRSNRISTAEAERRIAAARAMRQKARNYGSRP